MGKEYIADGFKTPSGVDLAVEALLKGGYTGNAKNLETLIIAASTGASGVSITPTSPAPSGTGIASFTATQAGTYTNYGGVVVAANSFAIISRSATGVFSISQTALDLTIYAQKTAKTNNIFQTLNVSSKIDVRKLELYGTNKDTTYYLKRASNWYDPVDQRNEVLFEIADAVDGTVVCRIVSFGGSLRTGLLTENFVSISPSTITGKVTINWDLLSGEPDTTYNYAIQKTAQITQVIIGAFTKDSIKTISGIEEVICDNELLMGKKVYLTALQNNTTKLLIRIEYDNNGVMTVIGFLSVDTPSAKRTGREIVRVQEYLSSGYNFELTINWDVITIATFNVNGLQDYDLFLYVKKPEVVVVAPNPFENAYSDLIGVELADQFYRRTDGALIASTSYNTYKYDITTIVNPLYASAIVSGTGTALAVFLDASNVLTGSQNIGTTTATTYSRILLTIPANTKFVAVSNFSDNSYGKLEQAVQEIKGISQIRSLNQWYGKKVVGVGTSVSFGQFSQKSYMVEAARKLNFTFVQTSVPGLATQTLDNGSGGDTQRSFGSSSLSIAEYAALGVTIPTSPILPYISGGSYNSHYRSWENIFKTANADADLYLMAIAPNNQVFGLTDWNDFNKTTFTYNTGTFESHRKTFLGSVIYMINKMYLANPNARVVFIVDSLFALSDGRSDFNTFSAEFGIPVIDLWKKVQYNPKTKPIIWSESGTNQHPSTYAHTRMGEILANELLLIS